MFGLSVNDDDGSLERFHDRRKGEYEGYNKSVSDWQGYAASYASTGLRGLILVNAGSLLAIPAYLSSTSSVSPEVVTLVFAGAALLIISLVCSISGCLLAYINCMQMAEDAKNSAEMALGLEGMSAFRKRDPEIAEGFLAYYRTRDQNILLITKKINRLYRASLGFVIISVVVMVCAFILCGWGFYSSLNGSLPS